MATSIRLPEDIEQRLDKLASRTGRKKTFYIKQAIVEHLDGLEDLYLAEERLRKHMESKNSALSLQDMIDYLEVKN